MIALLAGCAFALAGCDSAEERAQRHYERALELIEQGEPQKAQIELRNVLRLQENNVEARYRFARLLHDMKDYNGAAGQYLRVVELDPRRVDARLALAEIFLLAGRREAAIEAEKHVDAALNVAPDDPQAQALKATVEYRLGQKEEGVARARKVLEAHPDNVAARLVLIAAALDAEKLDEAESLADEGLSRAPRDLSLNIVKLGLVEKRGDPAQLGERLRFMVETFPDNAGFRRAYARWLDEQGDVQGAEAQLRALADMSPGAVEPRLQVVRYLNAARGPEAARAELERLIASPERKVEYELALASLDLSQGKPEEAERRLREVAEREGASADGDKARVELARLMLRQGRDDEAQKLVEEVLANDPRNEAALTLRASRLIDEDKPEEAIRDLRAALDAAPRNPIILLKLAQAHERNGSRELAMERLGQAVQASNFDPAIALRYAQALIAQDKRDVAEKVLVDALSRHPQDRGLMVELARLRLERRDFGAALQLAERLEQIAPGDDAAARIRAAALIGQRRVDEAMSLLAAAARADDPSIETMASLVRGHLAAGEPEKAEAYLREHLQKNPNDARAMILLGSVQLARGDAAAAEAAFREAVRADPKLADGYANLARMRLAAGDEEGAEQVLREGIEAGVENDLPLRLALALRLDSTGRTDEAIAQYEALYARHPDAAIVANNYASLLAEHRADDPQALARAYAIAKRFQNARQPHLQDTYGWIMHLRGDDAAAEAPLRAAAAALPNNALVRYHAGVVLARLGRADEARAHLEAALELSKKSPFGREDEARALLAQLDAPAPEGQKPAQPDQETRE
ncbi:tetratricopeptide repeat protein [Oceanicella actignis]|uniref:Uncharacterized conserved protein HemY, contains two TPR repeats n=1 Tax=Oceanicella actignis TaxID=1189325 RepID=A0A1M7SW54_9RHOB|nr:tetratricopeptide repeat protein [Oceanicella actignis]SES73738.1 Uncharacterized conserved protein HemY, contains two TPR repeats [Oceanicella actignis]SHN62753.1 Uncharacterized conserved protein HemY, contains two TPR repeats [Oceanicella actignis]